MRPRLRASWSKVLLGVSQRVGSATCTQIRARGKAAGPSPSAEGLGTPEAVGSQQSVGVRLQGLHRMHCTDKCILYSDSVHLLIRCRLGV